MKKVFIIIFLLLVIVVVAIWFLFLTGASDVDRKFIIGPVIKIADKIITLEVDNSVMHKEDKKEVSFRVDYSTKFFKQTADLKSKESFDDEQEAFLISDNPNKEAPSWNIEEAIKKSELEIGTYLKIYYDEAGGNLIAKKVLVIFNENKRSSYEDLESVSYGLASGKVFNINKEALSIEVNKGFGDMYIQEFSLLNSSKVFIRRLKSEETFRDEEKKYQKALLINSLPAGEAPEWFIYEEASYDIIESEAEIEIEYFEENDKMIVSKIYISK